MDVRRVLVTLLLLGSMVAVLAPAGAYGGGSNVVSRPALATYGLRGVPIVTDQGDLTQSVSAGTITGSCQWIFQPRGSYYLSTVETWLSWSAPRFEGDSSSVVLEHGGFWPIESWGYHSTMDGCYDYLDGILPWWHDWQQEALLEYHSVYAPGVAQVELPTGDLEFNGEASFEADGTTSFVRLRLDGEVSASGAPLCLAISPCGTVDLVPV